MRAKAFQLVNGRRFAILALAALVLTAAAALRGAEYDEQYTLFLTAGTPRPVWPAGAFPAGDVARIQSGHASAVAIADALRRTDVHPPLYFWAIGAWRRVFGPTLFAARLFSVACGVLSLALLGGLARRLGVPRPNQALLITLGCYGFAYTNAIARGFAPAETLLLAGATLLAHRRPARAGVALGAACACNYLAVFTAAAAILSTRSWRAVPAMLPFLALDGWFFAAQRASRAGQFPPFALLASLGRLAKYQLAAVFGGLPLYVDGPWRGIVAGGIAAFALIVVAAPAMAAVASRMRGRQAPALAERRAILACAIAPAVGLIMLGIVFDNTPIELRYLAFGLPFLALLLSTIRRPILLTLQAAAIAGLLFAPRTMQPARAAARAAAALPAGTLVLVPAGNDGVGIVGAFGIEAPPGLIIQVLHANDPLPDRFVLATLAQDRDSTAAIAALHTGNWRRIAIGSNLESYERLNTAE